MTVARKVERETADETRAFKNQYGIRGVRLETDTKRYYPNSSLACHLIGFVGMDNTGLEGIEARYDSALTGSAGRTVRATNAYGTELLFSEYEQFQPGEDGYDIVTTLDAAIQYMIEKHLEQAIADFDIQNGAGAICMDVNTGAILAMVSLDGYDLNAFLDVSDEAQAFIDAADSEEEAQRRLDVPVWIGEGRLKPMAQQGPLRHLRARLYLQDHHPLHGFGGGRGDAGKQLLLRGKRNRQGAHQPHPLLEKRRPRFPESDPGGAALLQRGLCEYRPACRRGALL